MRTFSPEFVDFLKVVATEPCVILDTETTGLTRGEIVQIAMCDLDGKPLLNKYVRPKNPIPPDATRIHGITDEMVSHAETWESVRFDVIQAIANKTVLIYNAVYDRSMMHQTDEAWSVDRVDYKLIAPFHCVMLAYAEFYGEWNDYRGNYKWQSLSNAAAQQHLAVKNAHDALGDCLMTAGLVRVMRTKGRLSARYPHNINVRDIDPQE